ncbi:enhancer of Polycomb [Lycorma delicatula]|uniref:enhancer of Polycomb n=1 Tax=Lycorma delicatula TaxID=130591 RepID=UPI003F5127BE
MNKLSFRARALDGWKPMPIYMSEELPDLPEYSAINRAVPQMPSGMKKEEECEHHLQRAIVTGLIIPIPEVTCLDDVDLEAFNRMYPANYKVPRQLIHMQPYAMEQDIPNYDMDSEDEAWVNAQVKTLDITPLKFEEMMDRLEENSGHSVVTQSEAKLLLKEDDDLIIAVYDYWLNKRLKTQQPLIPTVKTEAHRSSNSNNNPYVAFQRRTEKMQTRKNRKNDETSYEKMVKLRRDLRRALTLLELVKRRENTKRELLHLTIEIFEKRYQAGDWSGQLLTEVTAMKNSRPAFAPLFTNQFGVNQTANWANKQSKEDLVPRKEKRQYKKRKHKISGSMASIPDVGGIVSSGDDDGALPGVLAVSPTSPPVEEAPFTFRRSKLASYQPPIKNGIKPWYPREGTKTLTRCRFHPILITTPRSKSVVSGRGRYGRGGRLLVDRGLAPGGHDDFWEACGFKIQDSHLRMPPCPPGTSISTEGMKMFRPKTPPRNVSPAASMLEELPEQGSGDTQLVVQVEDLTNTEDLSPIQMNMTDLFPGLGTCEGNPLESEFLFLELTVNNNSNVEVSNQKDSIDSSLTSSTENKPVKLEQPPAELSPDLLSVDFKDLIGSSGILFDRLSNSVDATNSVNSVTPVKKERTDSNSSDNKNNGTKVLSNEKYENSGSLLDRWARFESNSDVSQVRKSSKQLMDNFIGDDSNGHSAFKTINSSPPLKKNLSRTSPKKKCDVGGVSGVKDLNVGVKDLVILDRYSSAPKNPPVNVVQPSNPSSDTNSNRLMARPNTSWTYRRNNHTSPSYLSTKFVTVKPHVVESSNVQNSSGEPVVDSTSNCLNDKELGQDDAPSTQTGGTEDLFNSSMHLVSSNLLSLRHFQLTMGTTGS